MKKYITFLFLFLFSLAQTAFGMLDLHLTKGIRGAIPIAIIPFSGQGNLSPMDQVSSVIQTDLENSGRFTVMLPSEMKQIPHSASEVHFSYWQDKGQSNLVVGSVQPVATGRYRVLFQLLTAYDNKIKSSKNAAPTWQSTILLSNTFVVNTNQLRALAHHISDLIYQHLTGDKGIFSTRIAYVVAQSLANNQKKYILEVSDMDGYHPKPLLKSNQPIMSPVWSPDGTRVAYVSFEKGDPVIYIQNVASGGRQVVSQFSGLNSAPAWSPDGKKLALVLTRTDYPKIFIMQLGSHQLKQVTDGFAIDTEPVWSADGRALYFTSNRGGGPQIYRVNVNGGAVSRITFEGKYNASASLSADGKTLAVLNGTQNQYNIAVQDIASGRYMILTQSGNDQAPSIAPNGKMIIYATQSNGQGVLGIVSIDGKVNITLPAREGEAREPAWGPFQ